MDFLVLGSLRVRVDGQLTEIRSATPRALLGLLLVHPNQIVSGDRMLEEIWGDRQPKGGLKTLRYHISKLRDALEPGRNRGEEGIVETAQGGYVLRVESDAIDSARFERLASEGAAHLSEGRFGQAREALGEALDLWRGAALEDFRYESFSQGPIARLEEMRLTCLENRLAADLELGRHGELVAELRELTTDFPLRENLWARLMVALYRTGQQSEALTAYQRARTVLGEQVGVEPNAALRRLEDQILRHELPFDVPRQQAKAQHNLPARIASFVGRDNEINAVEQMVKSHRLVAITGFGGIGKTSLAIELARRLADREADGVWLVELASLSDPRDVVGELARLLDIAQDPSRTLLDAVIEQLALRSAVLVIDNCEHLIDEAARVIGALLERCPDLRILATSRERLGIPGEQVWPVPPLEFPEFENEITASEAARYDAVRLFCDRASETTVEFDLGPGNVSEVIDVCRRVDGIPLAIELAAARLRLLSVRDLLDHLEDRFSVLTDGGRGRPQRHETLLATMEWSYGLLSSAEQRLLSRLAVFDGAFTLAAAEEVCAHDGMQPRDVGRLIGGLVEASLVIVIAGEPQRFDILQTVRDYAAGLLEASGEEQELRRRHADYYSGLISHQPDFESAEMADMLDHVSGQEANFRGALAWTVDSNDAERAAVLASRLSLHWFYTAQQAEATYWFPRVLELKGTMQTVERARLLSSVGYLAAWSGQTSEAEAIADEVAQIAEELGNQSISDDAAHLVSECLVARGDIAGARQVLINHGSPNNTVHSADVCYSSVLLGDFEQAAACIGQLDRLATAKAESGAMTGALASSLHGLLAHYRGDLDTARRLQHGALAEMRRLGRDAVGSTMLSELAQICLATGDIAEAEDWARQMIELGRHNAVSREIADGYAQLARAALRRQRIVDSGDAAASALDYAPDDACSLAAAVAVTAQLAFAGGDPTESCLLHAGAEELRRAIGLIQPLPRRKEIDHELAQLRAALDLDVYEEARRQGASSSPDELLSRARSVATSISRGAREPHVRLTRFAVES